MFFSDISDERRPVSFAVEIVVRLHESKQNVVRNTIYFQRLVLVDNENAFQMRREGKEIPKKISIRPFMRKIDYDNCRVVTKN